MVMAYEPEFVCEKNSDNGIHMSTINGIRRDGRYNDSLQRTCAEIRIFSSCFQISHEEGKTKVQLVEDLNIVEARELARKLNQAADKLEEELKNLEDE